MRARASGTRMSSSPRIHSHSVVTPWIPATMFPTTPMFEVFSQTVSVPEKSDRSISAAECSHGQARRRAADGNATAAGGRYRRRSSLRQYNVACIRAFISVCSCVFVIDSWCRQWRGCASSRGVRWPHCVRACPRKASASRLSHEQDLARRGGVMPFDSSPFAGREEDGDLAEGATWTRHNCGFAIHRLLAH